jgi:hypothetical protein
MVVQGVSLWHSRVCTMYPSKVYPLHYSPSLPFLKWLWQFLMSHVHTCIENTSIIVTLLYPPPPTSVVPLWPVLDFYPSLFKCVFIAQRVFVLIFFLLNIFLFIYLHVHTLFGSFLHHALFPYPYPLPSSVSGRSLSALITDFVEERTYA